MSNFETLALLVGEKIYNVEREEDIIYFHTNKGDTLKLWHEQSCCEEVYISDISGDLNNLVGGTIVEAEEIEGGEEGLFTWVFYKFRTEKEIVVIRFNQQLDTCYSVAVKAEWIEQGNAFKLLGYDKENYYIQADIKTLDKVTDYLEKLENAPVELKRFLELFI